MPPPVSAPVYHAPAPITFSGYGVDPTVNYYKYSRINVLQMSTMTSRNIASTLDKVSLIFSDIKGNVLHMALATDRKKKKKRETMMRLEPGTSSSRIHDPTFVLNPSSGQKLITVLFYPLTQPNLALTLMV